MPVLLKLLLIVKLELQLRLGVNRLIHYINHLLMATFTLTGDQVWLVPSKPLANLGLWLTIVHHRPSFQEKERAKANNPRDLQQPLPPLVRVTTVSGL